jgi:hypothetical protein
MIGTGLVDKYVPVFRPHVINHRAVSADEGLARLAVKLQLLAVVTRAPTAEHARAVKLLRILFELHDSKNTVTFGCLAPLVEAIAVTAKVLRAINATHLRFLPFVTIIAIEAL